MKKLTSIFAAIMVSVTCLAGCGGQATNTDTAQENKQQNNESKKLVVYSPNSEDIINTIIPMFEDKTGIEVELVSAGTGELLKRIQSEKENPYADIMFGGSAAQFSPYKDLFENYTSANDDQMMEGHRNIDGYMTPYIADGSCLLVNKNLIGDIKIEGYADLLNPELKGKIASADPTSSGSAFCQLTNMLLAMGGDYTSDAGWDYVQKLVENLDGKLASGSSAAHRSVVDGEYVVALTYEDPSASYIKNGADDVEIVYPKEGTVYLDATTSIVKNGPNTENAKKFIDFITSKEAQDAFGSQLTNRPLRSDAKLGDYMKPMEDIKTITEDNDYVTNHKDEIVTKYSEIATSLQK